MKIAFMPGDGIGPEISAATRLVLEAVDKKYGFGFTYSEIDIGFTALGTYGSTLPDASFSKAKEADALILGRSRISTIRPANRAGSTLRANCASVLTSMPISGRRGHVRD